MAERFLSALIVPLPAAETAVGDLRKGLDPAAALGVPAHVTVHFPWLPEELVDDDALEQLAGVAASVPAFDVELRRVGWFGEGVLWLDPEPVGPFHDLISASARCWPELPLYGGEFDDVVPHVTVGIDRTGRLPAVARTVEGLLPISDRAAELLWITRRAYDPWVVRLALDLG